MVQIATTARCHQSSVSANGMHAQKYFTLCHHTSRVFNAVALQDVHYKPLYAFSPRAVSKGCQSKIQRKLTHVIHVCVVERCRVRRTVFFVAFLFVAFRS